jgi:putative sterol carrier protein
MPLYPSEQWLAEYGRLIDESDALDDFAFDENILIVLTDLQLCETTIGDLPEQLLSEIPDSVRDDVADMSLAEALSLIDEDVRSSMPDPIEELLGQTEEDVVNGNLYIHIQLDRGSCSAVGLVTNPNEVDAECVFRGTAKTWQSIVRGRPATAAMLKGDVEIIGYELRILQHAAELQLLGDIASDVETEFLFEHHGDSLVKFLFDEAMRQPITVQKLVYRQAALTMRALTPFSL